MLDSRDTGSLYYSSSSTPNLGFSTVPNPCRRSVMPIPPPHPSPFIHQASAIAPLADFSTLHQVRWGNGTAAKFNYHK